MFEIKTVEIHKSPAEFSSDWESLEKSCPISGYQTRRWIEPWFRTIGAALGCEPLFILARDETGAPALLFTLAVEVKGRLRIASYTGGRDSNINMPLVQPDVRCDPATVRRVLGEGAQKAHIDAYSLINQPVKWRGVGHPLTGLPSQPSPSLLHSTTLPAHPGGVLEKMSNDSRKRMRWRLRKLEEIGPVSFIQARTRAEVAMIVEAFREQKKVRLDAMGATAGFDIDLVASFLEEAALTDEPGVELHALLAGDHVAAMYGGAVHDGAYHAIVNSFDSGAEISRSSPGELVIIRLLESLCKRGVTEFDLGVGEAAYKEKWCDRHEPLFDSLIGVSAGGKAYALGVGVKQRLKRQIKQNPRLWALAKKVRAKLGRGA